jgi:SAM-dependent methyltransferase
MRDVAYQDQTFNTPNPIARYAHRARLRYSLNSTDPLLPRNGVLLDFGCGTGDFLQAFSAIRPDADLIGYEPYLCPSTGAFARVASMEDVGVESIDLLCAFEVLEHLSDDDLARFMEHGRRLLKPSGIVVVSIPIIGGLTLVLKEVNRMVLFRRRSEYTMPELLKATLFGISAPRPEDRKPTHKGFDFRALRGMLSAGFHLESEAVCPFRGLPWWLNSQIFLTLRKTAA